MIILEKSSIEKKQALYKKNYVILFNEILEYIRENIRNNVHNNNYEIKTLRQSIKKELDGLLRSNGHYIAEIIHYKPNSSINSRLIKSVANSACIKYSKLMLEKYPHLNKKPKPKHHSRLPLKKPL